MNFPLISIIVPTYNRSEMLRGAIESLVHQKTGENFSFEIIIINDASTDDTNKVVREIISHSQGLVRCIHGEGKGYTSALNKGVAESRGDWVALFDDDELAAKDWLKELFAFAEKTGAHCVGGSRLLAIPEDILFQLGPVCRGLIGEDLPNCEMRECNSRTLPIGGHMLIKRSVFDSIGVFDEKMLTGGCDRDLVLRMMDAGFVVGLTPKAVVRHLIPVARLTPEHLRWYSLQFGNSFAHIDFKRLGRWKTTLACVARIGQALIVNLPLLLLAFSLQKRAEIQDRKILLWRAVGYAGKTLSLLAPQVFPEKWLLARLEFRKEREILPGDSKVTG